MQSWICFWNLIFWLLFASFTSSNASFLKFLLMSEMMWVVIYIYALLIGTLNDEISIMSMSFFILALAGMEFCSGILLAILFKRIIKIELFNDQNVNQKKVLSFFRGKAAK